ncbi:MAG: alpha/beta fold hydrolase [Actinobacteria bacterium]|nr:alpha/beta fold hydrolase [Actinomycetota bacterium]
MKQLVLAVVTLIGVLLVVIWAVQRRLIYLPSPGPVPPAQDVLEGAREVTLQTSDGLELGAWFFSGRSRTNGMTVLVANGNAGDRSLRSPLAKALGREGFAVLLFDYRGYGGNPGHPSEDGLARDVRAAYRFLTEDEGIRPDRLIYFGESLGAAVVTELATEHPPAGLVLRSPFSDLAAVGRMHYPFLPINLLLRDRFPVLEHIREVAVPTAVVYGTRDGIVPPEQSRAVAQAAAGPTAVVELRGADHNDVALLNGRELIDAIVELARRIKRPA